MRLQETVAVAVFRPETEQELAGLGEDNLVAYLGAARGPIATRPRNATNQAA